MNGSNFSKPEVEIIDRLLRSRILTNRRPLTMFDDLTVSRKSYFSSNLSFIVESGLVKYSAGDYVSIFRSFRPNPPNNAQVTL